MLRFIILLSQFVGLSYVWANPHDSQLSPFDGQNLTSQGAQSEQKEKATQCHFLGTLAQAAEPYYQNRELGVTKTSAKESLLMEFEPESLTYILLNKAVDDAFSGMSAEDIYAKTRKECLSKPLKWVLSPDATWKEVKQGAQSEDKWEKAGCEKTMIGLTMVHLYYTEGSSESSLREKITAAVKDKKVAQKLGDALMRSEDDYYEAVLAFESTCGQ